MKFQNKCNTKRPTIKLEFKVSKRKNHILDMEASIKNKRIYVIIYKKYNNLQTFLNINSEHPTSIKKSILNG